MGHSQHVTSSAISLLLPGDHLATHSPDHPTTWPPGHLATWSPDHLPLKGGVGPAMGLWRDDQFKGKSGAADAPKVHTGHCPKPHLRERNILYS